MKLTSLGKLSSKGPRRPFGYQMKWPMPSDAKSSPWFHAVRPEIVPLHSFCQTLFPILRMSPRESVIAHDMCGQSAIVAATTDPAKEQRPPNASLRRLSPWIRGEDEGEGFETRCPWLPESTLPLSLGTGRGDPKLHLTPTEHPK